MTGSEVNVANGKTYTYSGHFLGDGTINYLVDIFDADGECRGRLTGEFVYASGGDPRKHLEEIVRCAMREGSGYRP